MKQIQFSGANGFPAKCYEHIFDQLDGCQTHFVNTFAHTYESDTPQLWEHIADEIIHDIESRRNSPVVGIGHSSGATATYLAATKRPDLFSNLILIEPIVLKIYVEMPLRFLNVVLPSYKTQLEIRARRRRSEFQTRDDAREYFARKSLFASFHPDAFDAYIEHGLKAEGNGFTLTFSKEVEAKIFSRGVYYKKNAKNTLPVTCIFATNSNLGKLQDIAWWEKKVPHTELIFRECGHLVPFEEPREFVALTQAIIDKNKTALDVFR